MRVANGVSLAKDVEITILKKIIKLMDLNAKIEK